MQNRGNFDVFVHPNSGWEHEDHAKWAFWYESSNHHLISGYLPVSLKLRY